MYFYQAEDSKRDIGVTGVQTCSLPISTLCYQLGDAQPVYALEGSIAVTGSLVQWVRDNLGMIKSAPEIEDLARSVEDNGGSYRWEMRRVGKECRFRWCPDY